MQQSGNMGGRQPGTTSDGKQNGGSRRKVLSPPKRGRFTRAQFRKAVEMAATARPGASGKQP